MELDHGWRKRQDELNHMELALDRLESQCIRGDCEDMSFSAWEVVVSEVADIATICNGLEQYPFAVDIDQADEILFKMDDMLTSWSMCGEDESSSIWNSGSPELVDAVAECFFDLTQLCENAGLVVAFQDETSPMQEDETILKEFQHHGHRNHESKIDRESEDEDGDDSLWFEGILDPPLSPKSMRELFTDMYLDKQFKAKPRRR
ncbi:hypothetical protein Ae201684_012126 [Aphanomyces euteiches]|uniref:Uncharacterized protein n=2 Tax=Aphanomyces euteiches TaxID=100861 RepID=A0A6G0WSL9_9STRA|nr:hypothetical protein Ae201684_012126 [Aphanomyces euteiches]